MDLNDASKRLQLAIERFRLNRWKRKGEDFYSQLGDEIGRSGELIRQWHKGKAFPPLQVIPSVCEALGIEPVYLLFGIDEKFTPARQIVSEEDADFIADFNMILEEDQTRIRAEVKKMADIARAYQEKFGKSAENDRVKSFIPPISMTEDEEKARVMLEDPRVQALIKEIEQGKR